MSKSCWGCGSDWKERWKSADLGQFHLKGVPEETETFCPDCYEEALQSELVEDVNA